MSKIQKIYVIYDNIKIKNHDMGGGGGGGGGGAGGGVAWQPFWG